MDAPPRRRFDLVAYLKLFRFPLVFTAVADSAAGYLLAVSQVGRSWAVLGLLAVASSGLYCFGMAMNDIADRKRDQQIAPTRVLPSGRLSLKAAVIASFGVLTASFFAVLFLPTPVPSWQRLLVWGLAVAGILTYDFGLKVPPTMGFVRACNFLLGICSGFHFLYLWYVGVAISLAMALFLYVTSLTFVSTLEDTGKQGPKLWIGAAGMICAAWIAASWSQVSGYLMDYLYHVPPARWSTEWRVYSAPALSWAAVTGAGVLTGWILFRARRARDRRGVMLLVRDGLVGIIVLDAVLLMSLGELQQGLLLSSLLFPAAISVAIFKKLA